MGHGPPTNNSENRSKGRLLTSHSIVYIVHFRPPRYAASERAPRRVPNLYFSNVDPTLVAVLLERQARKLLVRYDIPRFSCRKTTQAGVKRTVKMCSIDFFHD